MRNRTVAAHQLDAWQCDYGPVIGRAVLHFNDLKGDFCGEGTGDRSVEYYLAPSRVVLLPINTVLEGCHWAASKVDTRGAEFTTPAASRYFLTALAKGGQPT